MRTIVKRGFKTGFTLFRINRLVVPVRGFELASSLITAGIVLLIVGVSLAAQGMQYFPKTVFGDNLKSNQEWTMLYSKHLSALREPSLFEQSKSSSLVSYRFLWLRSFHNPLSVRFDMLSGGTAVLTIKIGSSEGNNPARKPIKVFSRRLDTQQTEAFLDRINTSGFWTLAPQEDPVSGPDGAQWVIEGVRNGEYRAVHRFTPQNGPVRNLGLALAIDFGHLKIPATEIY